MKSPRKKILYIQSYKAKSDHIKMNIFRSKRYTESTGESKMDGPISSFFGGKKEPVARKALGDITNASGSNVTGGKDVLGKKVLNTIQPAETDNDAHMVMDDERVYMRRDADNIDARDNDNPLLCSTYVNEMYDLFRASENEFKVNAVNYRFLF